jgi:Ohr subfamily peroxiredoxin
MAVVARKRKIRLPDDTAIDAEVDLNLILADGTYFLRARLNVSVPGVDRELAQAIVNEADQICPYSRATRGNIDVAINLV